MPMNVFEGARRVSIAIGAFWVCGWIASVTLNEPYVYLSYRVDGLGALPVRDDQCGDYDATHYIFDAKDDRGRSVPVRLCFKAMRADNGEWLIPYAPADNGRWWLARRYSAEVTQHMTDRGRTFRIPPNGYEEAASIRWKKKCEAWEFAALGASIGIVVGWILMTGIGWIVRGFLGIPHGRDARPPE